MTDKLEPCPLGDDAGLVEPRFLLVKRGLYYRPNDNGYTGIKDHAGRYLESDAWPECGVTAIHEDEAPDYSEACYSDLMAKHASEKIAALTADNARLTRELDKVNLLLADVKRCEADSGAGRFVNLAKLREVMARIPALTSTTDNKEG